MKGYKSFFNVDWKFFRVVVLNYRNLLNVFFVRIVLGFMFFVFDVWLILYIVGVIFSFILVVVNVIEMF